MARKYALSLECVQFLDTKAEIAIRFRDGSQLQFEMAPAPNPKPVGHVNSEAHGLFTELKHVVLLGEDWFALVFQDGSSIVRKGDGNLFIA